MSIETCFPSQRSRQWLQVGPLVEDLDELATHLAMDGYAPSTARDKLRFVRHLSLWLAQEEAGIEALDEQRFGAFLLARGSGSTPRDNMATGRQLLRYLRGKGRIPAAYPAAEDDSPLERIKRDCRRFLVQSAARVPRRR